MSEDKGPVYVSIQAHELRVLCEMAKSFLDAFGDEIEADEETPAAVRQEDQRYLGLHVVWERADRLVKGLPEATQENSGDFQ